MEIVRIEDLRWKYSEARDYTLKGVNLSLEEGKFLGIVGPNGAGKTTLVYTLNGLIPYRYNGIKKGRVFIYGHDTEATPVEKLTSWVGLVFSDPEAQFTSMTVEDELVFGMENIGLDRKEIKIRLEWVTELTNTASLLEKPPYELSGGQKQRVAIASVLAMKPKLLIMDEPTSMLDPIGRETIFEVIARLKQEEGITIIAIEHNLELLAAVADDMALLNNGQIIFQGQTREFFNNYDLLIANQIYPPEVTQMAGILRKEGYWPDSLPLDIEQARKQIRKSLARVV